MNRIFLVIGIAIVAILVASSSLFIVDQRQVAVIKTFGEIKSVVTEPGLNFNRRPRSSPPRRRAWSSTGC
jgi:membrane protease subunit HflC